MQASLLQDRKGEETPPCKNRTQKPGTISVAAKRRTKTVCMIEELETFCLCTQSQAHVIKSRESRRGPQIHRPTREMSRSAQRNLRMKSVWRSER